MKFYLYGKPFSKNITCIILTPCLFESSYKLMQLTTYDISQYYSKLKYWFNINFYYSSMIFLISVGTLRDTAWKLPINLRIQSKYGKIRTRKNSVFGHFSRSVTSKRVGHDLSKYDCPARKCKWSGRAVTYLTLLCHRKIKSSFLQAKAVFLAG